MFPVAVLPDSKSCLSCYRKRKRKAAEPTDTRQAYASGDVSVQTGQTVKGEVCDSGILAIDPVTFVS